MTTKALKIYFIKGLAVLLPTIVTIWILVWGYRFIQNSLGVYVNRILALVTITILSSTGSIDVEWWRNFFMHGLGSIAGFIISLAIVLGIGILVAHAVGKSLWLAVEQMIMKVPILNQIFPHIKQVTDFALSQEKAEKLFTRVVLVEFPRKGAWAVGMMTGSGIPKLQEKMGKKYINVFVASTPSPLTGFAIIVAEDETIDPGMTIEEAIKFIISGGVISPQSNIKSVSDAELINNNH